MYERDTAARIFADCYQKKGSIHSGDYYSILRQKTIQKRNRLFSAQFQLM